MAIRPGPQPVRQSREPRRPRLPRHRPPPDPRPERLHRRCAAGSRTRTSPATRRDVLPDRHAEEHRLRLRQGEGRRARSRSSRSTLADHFLAPDAGRRRRPDRDRRVRLGPDPGRRRRPRPLVRAAGGGDSGPRSSTSTAAARTAGPTSCPGIKDLVVLKSTGSEFHGFLKDEYTTLQETNDRILATSLVARWRYDQHRRRLGQVVRVDPAPAAAAVRRDPQPRAAADAATAWARAVLEQHPEVAEIRFSAPNKHHFLVDLSPFGVENPGEVFYRRGPPLRPDRGHRRARRRLRRRLRLARRARLLLTEDRPC